MSLTNTAMARLRAMIINGELGPGDRLPPEKELAERLGLSRSSLREAVKALEVVRILDIRQGDGTYVTELNTQHLSEAITFVLELHQNSSVLELLETRRVLEAASVELAAARISEQQLDEIQQTLDNTDVSDLDSLVDQDLAFHGIIGQAAGNAYLSSLTGSLNSRTVRARAWRGMTQQGSAQRTVEEHQEILEALRRRDPALARAAMIHHLQGVERWLRVALTETPSSEIPEDLNGPTD